MSIDSEKVPDEAKQAIAKEIFDTSHLTGVFTLRSGQVSNEYFDKYLFESKPDLLAKIATIMKEGIPQGTGVLAGLELGGIPIVTVISAQAGIAAAFIRKKAKEYGTCKLAEGADVAGKYVCIVEDVVTTGGAIIDGVRELRALGAKVDTVICAIQRNEAASAILAEHGLTLVPAFTMDYILETVGGGLPHTAVE
ncbi:MAG: orotate phosphoribosyltransferase [Oscillospiraceae bacterium]|nr:orotate phosphoribosyltransferase [Oscillospiraceae bacterium]